MLLEALTFAALAAAPATDAGAARPRWVEQFEALRPQKGRLKIDLDELNRLARMSGLSSSRLRAEADKLAPFARYHLVRRMILLESIASELRPSIDALSADEVRKAVLARYPHLESLLVPAADLAGNPPVDPRAVRLAALAARLRVAATLLCSELREGLTDAQRRQVVAQPEFFLPPPPIDDPASLVHAAQELDALIDAVLGLRFEQTELGLPTGEAGKKLYGDHFTYIDGGRSYHAVQTPYADLARVIDAFAPQPNDRVVDLGSGYGRICFYVAVTRPGVGCVGYEIVPERVAESARVARALGFDRVSFEARDLTDPALTPVGAAFYFAYDPVNYRVVGKVLADLETIARTQQLRLAAVEGRGGFHALLRKQPWLKQVKAVPTVRWSVMLPPVLIFESAPVPPDGG